MGNRSYKWVLYGLAPVIQKLMSGRVTFIIGPTASNLAIAPVMRRRIVNPELDDTFSSTNI